MNDSSSIPNDQFEGLEWRHALAFQSVLRECDYTKSEYIKKKYAQHASNFSETLAFLDCLRAVREEEGHIRQSEMWRHDGESGLRSWLVHRLFHTSNRYRTQIFEYLRKFPIVDGEPLYRPSFESRHCESNVRNFLMELGIVRHDKNRDCYRIAPEHLDLYVLAQDSLEKLAPETVATVQRSREALGTTAEEAIVSYERRRVGANLADHVVHVALTNAGAGYDVRSVTVNNIGKVQPRYIEVKAVSGSSLRFHWTRNELTTSKLLTQWYYLYLLPVMADGRLAIGQLEVIRDPYTAVIRQSDVWAVEPDVLRCCLRQERISNPGVQSNGD